MVALRPTLLNELRDYAKTRVSHIGLWGHTRELSGGDPPYTRLPVTWVDGDIGIITPATDLTFNIPPEATITAWRGFSSATGGVNFGGGTFGERYGPYKTQGVFDLLANFTTIRITSRRVPGGDGER